MDVVIEQGALQGLQSKTILSNKPYVSFLGIPYAKPPINDLRFKAPVKHPGWSGVLKAISEGDKCMQFVFMTDHITGSEDCLYLNVLVPQQNELRGKLAVMVFIHGGVFNFGCGSVNEHSPDYLLDENVIVVMLNYRLNVLGFLNLDIDECPGNMGLKDQLFAIKWVKANIAAFGGDANNITIFGESAGSASVHCHTISPQSTTGLFQKAIMQSGCALNPWALNENHRVAALKFANNLGCLSSDPVEIVKYLKNVPAIDLVKGSKFKDETDFLSYKFLPSIESDTVSNPFLPAHPEKLVNSTSPIPVIIGVNNMEGIIALSDNRISQFSDAHITNEISKIFENRYSAEVISKIKDIYFNKRNIESETTKLENICHLHTDVFFVKDFYRGFDKFLKQEVSPVYKYEFKFDGELNAVKNMIFATRPVLRQAIKGACHADEIYYLFHGKLSGVVPKPNSPELEMCKTMSKMWSNFAKSGDPNSSDLSFKWINATASDPKYLSIDGDRTRMAEGKINSDRLRLWQDISKSVV